MEMREKYKRLAALLFDGLSFVSFAKSLDYINQLGVQTIPSKEIALIEDYAILALQSGETIIDITKKFEPKGKLSKVWNYIKSGKMPKIWHYIKSDGIPFVLGAVAVTAFYSYQFNPVLDPSLGSNICWVIGLASQYAKNKILYGK